MDTEIIKHPLVVASIAAIAGYVAKIIDDKVRGYLRNRRPKVRVYFWQTKPLDGQWFWVAKDADGIIFCSSFPQYFASKSAARDHVRAHFGKCWRIEIRPETDEIRPETGKYWKTKAFIE